MTPDKKSPRIFYGWWIVAAMVVIGTYMGSVVFFGFTAFVTPIEASFPSWPRAILSLSTSFRGMESGLLAPFAGKLVDRYGPRRLIFVGSIIVALSLFMLSKVNSLWMFYLSFIILALGMSTCTLTVPMAAVTNWFHRKLGIAGAFAIVGFGLSGALVPVVRWLIDTYGWRETFLMLSVGVILIITPISLVFRHRPQPYGYLPDGDVEPPALTSTEEVQEGPVEKKWRVLEVLSNGVFWRITVTYICQMMVISAVVFHLMPYLESVGIARTSAGFVTMALALSSIIPRLAFGWLADRYERKMLSTVGLAVVAVSIVLFLNVSAQAFWLLIPFILIYGVGHGGNNALRAPMIVSYFGRANFGTVMGLVMGFCSLGTVLGPPLAGLVWDKMGNYTLAWYVGIGIAIIGMLSVWSLPKVRTKNSFG